MTGLDKGVIINLMVKRLLEFFRKRVARGKQIGSMEVEEFKKLARLGQNLIVMEVR